MGDVINSATGRDRFVQRVLRDCFPKNTTQAIVLQHLDGIGSESSMYRVFIKVEDLAEHEWARMYASYYEEDDHENYPGNLCPDDPDYFWDDFVCWFQDYGCDMGWFEYTTEDEDEDAHIDNTHLSQL
jgi:hypothetical protein